MSSSVAYARPRSLPEHEHELHPRHIEVVTTRAQRKARPKVAYAIATIASLFVIFAAQLLLSIVVSDGQYQIASLQGQQKDLLRTQQSLTEDLGLLGSSQYLAANAASLGMVPNSTPLYINVATGAVSGAPGTFDPAGCGGACNLVANDLLVGKPLVTPVAANAATGTAATTPNVTTPKPQTPGLVDTIPAPVTH